MFRTLTIAIVLAATTHTATASSLYLTPEQREELSPEQLKEWKRQVRLYRTAKARGSSSRAMTRIAATKKVQTAVYASNLQVRTSPKLSISKRRTTNVRGHWRTLPSGRRTYVRTHTRRLP